MSDADFLAKELSKVLIRFKNKDDFLNRTQSHNFITQSFTRGLLCCGSIATGRDEYPTDISSLVKTTEEIIDFRRTNLFMPPFGFHQINMPVHFDCAIDLVNNTDSTRTREREALTDAKINSREEIIHDCFNFRTTPMRIFFRE